MFEQAHAYVDGELDELERVRFEREMKQNPALAAGVKKLQALKSLVQETYGVRPVHGKPADKPKRKPARIMQVAAVWVLGVAVGGYWAGSWSV